ncbi:uncharacterized protein LOC127812069 isoform X2 [Diospyros lotus]|uniref:uncharacterized protein LOC127812069 isoform X2 n=1 Tax=Diospyros lotus TaxID=55363 RepID=UPI00225ACF27|nr:uncharacterized protein LOC127812069 isoform X2 [Diospyros lotus]
MSHSSVKYPSPHFPQFLFSALFGVLRSELAIARASLSRQLSTEAMSLLHRLWDDTVAGPPPETGLGKLRKNNTFAFQSSSGNESEGGMKVTQRIMVVKPPGQGASSQNGSPPVSPDGCTPPVSPFSGKSLPDFFLPIQRAGREISGRLPDSAEVNDGSL